MNKLLAIFILLAIYSCATVLGDRTVKVSEDEIQQKLNEKFAIPISLLKVFDVNLSNALVNFDKETGRMHTKFDTKLSSALFDESATGELGISGKLRFDVATSAIVLDEPKVEQFIFDGAGDEYNELINALASKLGGDLLNGFKLYQVKPEELKFGGTQYRPKQMTVTDDGLQLTFSPQ
ncbi:MAG TPA: DUF1439 domain-containing protein [Methylophilaceae bacterium]|nr:DUF1439 domain-containing protein [Methylophilaceae bacterium]